MNKTLSLRVYALVLIIIFVSCSAWAEYSLDAVDGDPMDAVYVDDWGNVGIGTTEPSANLTVKGNPSKPLTGLVEVQSGSYTVIGVGTLFTQELKAGDSILIGLEVFTVAGILSDNELTIDSPHSMGERNITAYTDSDLFLIKNRHDEDKFVIDRSGNVGIGTSAPSKKLEVAGSVKASAFEGDGSALTGITDAQIPDNITVNYASNADKLDGKNSNEFLDTSGNTQTKSGGLNISGSLGIGTSSPGYKLDVNGTLRSTSRAYLNGIALNNDADITGADQIKGYNDLRFYGDTSGGPDLFILANGNVGIGTTSPAEKLHVNGAVKIGNLKFWGNSYGDFQSSGDLRPHIGNGNFIIYSGNVAGSGKGLFKVQSNGNVGIGTTSPQGKLDVHGAIYHYNSKVHSDKRLKKEIKPLEDSLGKVAELQGVSYKWRTDEYPEMEFSDDIQIGLIAQEMEEVIPELVYTDSNGYKSISYERLTAVLVEAIKELKAENEMLRYEIEQIKKAIGL